VNESVRFQGSLAFSITAQTPERVDSEMPVQAGILNPFGVVQAGAMLWFADVTATALVLGSPHAEPGMRGFPLAIALHASFLANQADGTLAATSTFVRKGRTVSVVRTLVRGTSGKLLADVTTSHVLSR